MNSNAKIAAVSSTVVAASAAPSGGDFNDSSVAQEAERAARYRLVIEEGATKGAYIYKTLDRVTGEVVRQLPREQVVELGQAPDYSAGALVDTKA